MDTLTFKMVRVTGMATKLLEEYELAEKGWTFTLDTAKSRIGQCRYSDKEIGFSLSYLKLTPIEEIEETLRHEIAHALCGPGEGHGAKWKAMAIQVGAKPQSCDDGSSVS